MARFSRALTKSGIVQGRNEHNRINKKCADDMCVSLIVSVYYQTWLVQD